MPQIHPGFRRGYYYSGIGYVDTMSTQKVTSDRIYLILTYIPFQVLFNYIGISVTTSVSNSECKLAVYNNNQETGYPSSLYNYFGTVSTSSTGNKEIVINHVFEPGWYYLAAIFDKTPTIRAKNINEFNDYWVGSINAWSKGTYLYYNSTYENQLPDEIDAYSYTQSKVPYIWLRRD